MPVEFLSSGDVGLTVQFGHEIDKRLSNLIMALRWAVEEAAIGGVVETVPTYRSLLIHYDPIAITQTELIERIRPLIDDLDENIEDSGQRYCLPICFEDSFAVDLEHVASFAKMTKTQVQRQITLMDHYVYMLGFAPGLPYMGDLPEALALPRKETPVKRVEKGSVLIATGLTIIYPAVNPTGWHVIGRCPVPIFDLREVEPALLAPGDHVRFREVDLAEFRAIESQVSEGSYQIERDTIG